MEVNLKFGNKQTAHTNVFKTLLLRRHEIEELIDMNDVLGAVENAFVSSALDKTTMPPKMYLNLPDYNGDYRAMPAYIDGIAGIKWVSSYPLNFQNNMPSVLAIIIICDPNTSYPLAVMDGTLITNMRTGAAGALAAKYLARENSNVIGIVGSGRQAETQLLALNEVMPIIRLVKVFDQNKDTSITFARKMSLSLNIAVQAVESVEETTDSDVLITTTPSRTPIIQKHHIKLGTHINAIGADAQGKQELAPDILIDAKVVVDNLEQASHSGEINVPLSHGLMTIEHIYSTLGDIVAGIKKGRETKEEITVFDSTGLAIQDIACAKLVYEKARIKTGTYFTFF